MMGKRLKRWAATGLGLALFTKEKAEEAVQELVKQGELSRDEGREVLEQLLQRAQREKDEMQRRVDAEVRRLVEGAGLASAEDVRRLEARLDALEARLERWERAQPSPIPAEESAPEEGEGDAPGPA